MKDLQKVETSLKLHPASSHIYMTVCENWSRLLKGGKYD